MLSDEKRTSGNAFEGDLDLDPEIEQLFGDNQEVEGTEEVAEDLEIELLFMEGPKDKDEVARNGQRDDEEVAGTLLAKEAENRLSIWDTLSQFNHKKLLNI